MYSEGMSADPSGHRERLRLIARRAMLERGLDADFFSEALAQASRLDPGEPGDGRRDLRHLPWCSIDNDDSRDLDQLTVAEDLGAGRARVLVAIADVEPPRRAPATRSTRTPRHNTTSVYTAAAIFPMLPERLSTDLTSLNAGEDRAAMVVEMTVGSDRRGHRRRRVSAPSCTTTRSSPTTAVAAWLDRRAGPPPPLVGRPGARWPAAAPGRRRPRLEESRREQGALDFETPSNRDRCSTTSRLNDSRTEFRRNRAKEIIEHFMVAANGVTARFLEAALSARRFGGSSGHRTAGTGSWSWPRVLGETPADRRQTPARSSASWLEQRADRPAAFP